MLQPLRMNNAANWPNDESLADVTLAFCGLPHGILRPPVLRPRPGAPMPRPPYGGPILR
ncbi:MAG: hypothetical protein K6T78_09280 [Alicyclobacillus sp.]|nr:hypothetical protein [Alicyclobacillus sp.]